jgi:hypothetical protein
MTVTRVLEGTGRIRFSPAITGACLLLGSLVLCACGARTDASEGGGRGAFGNKGGQAGSTSLPRGGSAGSAGSGKGGKGSSGVGGGASGGHGSGGNAAGGAQGRGGQGGVADAGSGGCNLELWVDADDDGFGTEDEPSTWECTVIPGFATEPGDCNDQDPSFNPGALDTIGDGIDQDCDGFDGKSACEIDDVTLRPCGCDVVIESDQAAGIRPGCEGYIDAAIIAAEACSGCSGNRVVVAIRNRGGLTIPKNFTLVVEYSDGTFDFFPLRSEIPPGGAFPIVEFTPKAVGTTIFRIAYNTSPDCDYSNQKLVLDLLPPPLCSVSGSTP